MYIYYININKLLHTKLTHLFFHFFQLILDDFNVQSVIKRCMFFINDIRITFLVFQASILCFIFFYES